MTNESLMQVIQMYDFYLDELVLYLDTHPNCRIALDELKKYRELSVAAHEAYIKNYGPITAEQSDTTTSFTWVKDPWPWERSEK